MNWSVAMSNHPQLPDPHPLSAACRTFAGATAEVLWEMNLVFKVGGKMFAVFGMTENQYFSMKVPEELFHDLTQLPGVVAAPYMARAHWIQIRPEACQLDPDQLIQFLKGSYQLIFDKLSKRLQRTIEAHANSNEA